MTTAASMRPEAPAHPGDRTPEHLAGPGARVMRVTILAPGQRHEGVRRPHPVTAAAVPSSYGPWRPSAVLGAPAPGGLQLPPARPTASWLYAPRGVWLDAERVIVADTGNHRVLIWRGTPDRDGVAADVVLGQSDAESEGPGLGAGRLNLPTGVLVDPAGRLVVADAWNHRILIWEQVPDRTGTPADRVIGQPDRDSGEPNGGAGPNASSFYWPFGIALVDGRFHVADTGNRRVLVWRDGIPADNRPADVVLGQPGPATREENRGGEATAASFRWPHSVTARPGGGIVVADAGNHRLLGWSAHPDSDLAADIVVGQPDFASTAEFPYRRPDGRTLRFPYAAVSLGEGLLVADTANNRVLVWERSPDGPADHPDFALAQPGFSSIGENRWEQVGLDTLCWPYGLAGHGDRLVVADSGNNRVVLWRRA